MDFMELAKIIGPALAVGGAIIAITRYVTQLQDKVEYSGQLQELNKQISLLEQDARIKAAQNESEINELNDRLNRLAAEHEKTEEDYRLLLESGSSAAALKKSIDEELSQTAERLAASACSILVPSPSVVAESRIENLIFLSLHPDNPNLRKERVPIDSVAGHVLRDPKTVITQDPATKGAFSSQTDAVSGFKTANMLIVPLRHRGRCVGVAEFLNKRDGLSFDPVDSGVAEEAAVSIGPKVAEFISDARNLKGLGFTPRERAVEATILVSDISNYSSLAAKLDASIVIDLMNQYMESLCSAGMQFGGTIEQLQGDGFIMTFNVKKPLGDHAFSALAAAREMQGRFNELKNKWITLQYPGVQTIYNRIGLMCGPVRKAELGPAQFRQITVMGDAVNAATHLCQYASRQKDIIVVGSAFYERLNAPPPATKIKLQVPKRDSMEEAFEVGM